MSLIALVISFEAKFQDNDLFYFFCLAKASHCLISGLVFLRYFLNPSRANELSTMDAKTRSVQSINSFLD
jgi:hypothetical protein